MNKIYKLEFESVSVFTLIGSPYYRGEEPCVKASEVPDKDWVRSSRETDSPWQQYNQLKQWVKDGTQLIRNVKLYEMISEPQWKLIENN